MSSSEPSTSSPPAESTSGSSLFSQSSSTSPVSSADNSSTPPPASTEPSTTNAPTSASPTTSSTPTTTPQSSAAQTTSAAAQTTSPTSAASPSASTPSATSPTTTIPTTFTSQIATTLISTDPGGSVVYVTTTVPQVITTSTSSSTGGSSSSNTGVIVGAVVGGVAGIAILAFLLLCIRRRVRKDEFDGNFDPDRVVGHTDSGGGTLPNVDLTDDVTPFPQSYTDQGNSSMRQYGKSPYIPVPSSLAASGHASTEFYPPGTAGAGASAIDAQPRQFMPSSGAYLPPMNMYGTGPVDWHNPRPGVSPPPSTVSNNTSSTRATKEREAMGRGGQGTGLALATQPEAAEGSEDVVVHQDAGRAPAEEHTPPREIPPAYESIRQD